MKWAVAKAVPSSVFSLLLFRSHLWTFCFDALYFTVLVTRTDILLNYGNCLVALTWFPPPPPPGIQVKLDMMNK